MRPSFVRSGWGLLLAGTAVVVVAGLAEVKSRAACPGIVAVSATVMLDEDVHYLLGPPECPDPGQNITSAADLEQRLGAAFGFPVNLQVARWIPLGGSQLAYECYPDNSMPVNVINPGAFCWSSSTNLTWNAREGIEARFDSGGMGGGAFTWMGVEDPPANYTLYDSLNLVSVPYPPAPHPATASELWEELDADYTLQSIQRLLPASGTFQVYTYGTADFPVSPGEAYLVKTVSGTSHPSVAKLEGRLYRDTAPANGMPDIGELPLPQRLVRATNTTTLATLSAHSISSGDYTLLVTAGSYDLSVVDQAGESWTASGVACTTTGPNLCSLTTTAGTTVTGLDFGRAAVHDLGVGLYPRYGTNASSPCPNVPMKLCVRYDNVGDFPELAAEARLQLPPPGTIASIGTPVATNCSHPPSNLGGSPSGTNLFVWDIGGIDAGEGCTVCTEFTPTVPLGTGLAATASVFVSPGVQDGFTVGSSRNTDGFSRAAVCAFDPNDKQVTPGCGTEGYVAAEKTLTYLVRFQNLGNGPSTDVVVRDMLSRDLDLESLELVDTSHALTELELDENRILTFSFLGINLPPIAQGDAASRGYVLYRVKLPPGQPSGTAVSNTASIVFDLNAPVVTNTVVSTVAGDIDGDAVLDPCDNCPEVANPDQQPVVFGQTVVASSKVDFAWPQPADVDYVRGDLSDVAVYDVDLQDSAADTTSFSDLSVPAAGAGYYYLVRLGGACTAGSWQTVLGAEPGRDAALP